MSGVMSAMPISKPMKLLLNILLCTGESLVACLPDINSRQNRLSTIPVRWPKMDLNDPSCYYFFKPLITKVDGLQGKKVYSCSNCKMVRDRDINGAKNIFLKNYEVLGLGLTLGPAPSGLATDHCTETVEECL